jgi:basic amino acid/polyamine antiporter, APA family
LLLVGLTYAFKYNTQATMDFLTNEKQVNSPEDIVTSLDQAQTKIVYEYLIFKNEKDAVNSDLEALLSKYNENETTYKTVVDSLPIDESLKYQSGFNLFKHKIPMWIFLIDRLGVPSEFVFNSFTRIGFLLVYDGGIERVELDLFYVLAVDWLGHLLRI